MKNQFLNYLSDFWFLLYPRNCISCNNSLVNQENHICTSCKQKLPRTWYHYADDNPLAKMFWGRIPLHQAAAFLFYDKGVFVQKIIHELKYRSNRAIGEYIGKLYALDLIQLNEYKNADFIIPVPLHPRKERKRGYNQSEVIANGMAEIFEFPVNTDNLIRKTHTDSQTRKTKLERWENVKDIFILQDPILFENKHVLLIDDVITTGATIESAAMALSEAKGIKITALSIGAPHH